MVVVLLLSSSLTPMFGCGGLFVVLLLLFLLRFFSSFFLSRVMTSTFMGRSPSSIPLPPWTLLEQPPRPLVRDRLGPL